MAKQLQMNVILGGSTTAGFDALAGKIEHLGASIDQVGSHVREFEIDSVNTYRSYEDNMLAAEFALSAQYDSASELNKIMADLDAYASDWASSTIFHTNDVSEAINEAAHAGWDYQEIIKGIPQAMLIAQAGGLDLSTGLDYLIKMMNSTETEFGNMGTLIDQWAMASNRSATNIGEMGEAFMALGSSAQFADSTQELFTLLGILANVGTVGSQAGTALRGSMVRLVAPTTKAEDAMSLLGAEADEINDILADENVTKAAKKLEGLGFSAYDAQGKLKPFVDIYKDLYQSIQGLEEVSQNEILSAIFPTRNISTAKAFIAAVGNGKLDEMFKAIGDSEGYAAKGADIMMSGLTGSIETLLSKWEEFERRTGETLAPGIEKAADFLGQMVDYVNNIDDTGFSAIVGGLTGLAAAGPSLLVVGGVLKAIATLGPLGSGVMLASVAISATVAALEKMNDIKFSENFGTMQLDLDTFAEHLNNLSTPFETQLNNLRKFDEALNAAEEKYANSSMKMAESMLTDVLTGKTLTDEEKKNLTDYANDISKAVQDGLLNGEAKDMSLLRTIFGDWRGDEASKNGAEAAEAVHAWYQGALDEAKELGRQLREQMSEALTDGTLNETEQAAIQATVDRYNQIMAGIQNQMNSEEYYKMLWRSQGMGADSFGEYIDMLEESREKRIQDTTDAYGDLYAHTGSAFDSAIEKGLEYTTVNGERVKVTEKGKQEALDAVQASLNKAIAEIDSQTRDMAAKGFDQLMAHSNFGEAWDFLKDFGEYWRGQGEEFSFEDVNWGKFAPTEETVRQLAELGKANNNNRLIEDLLPFFSDEGTGSYIDLLRNAGQLSGYMQSYLERKADYEKSGGVFDLYNEFSTEEMRAQAAEIQALQSQLEAAQNQVSELETRQEQITQQIAQHEASLIENRDSFFYNLMGGESKDNAALFGTATQAGLYADLEKVQAELETANSTVAEIQAALDGLTPPELTVTAELDSSAVDSYEPPSKTMTVYAEVVERGGGTNKPAKKYAEGGRATVASIFGEDGAEWAIPEEHSQRTAELLNAAREASGFTWSEIISRFGGLNANPSGRSVNITYSPVINAGNASGVASVLAEDKERLVKLVRKALDEQRFRDEVEVYA